MPRKLILALAVTPASLIVSDGETAVMPLKSVTPALLSISAEMAETAAGTSNTLSSRF